MLYVDTSALATFYLAEPGGITSRTPALTSWCFKDIIKMCERP